MALSAGKIEYIRMFLHGRHICAGIGTHESSCSMAAINLALSGHLTDSIPDCMSKVIGRWIISIQDPMPDAMRNSDAWRSLLPLAAGTGRGHEWARLQIVMDWLWGSVLPWLQPLADEHGFGALWRKLVPGNVYYRTKHGDSDKLCWITSWQRWAKKATPVFEQENPMSSDVMSPGRGNTVVVLLTARELEVLEQLSKECDIPIDRVLVQGLRSYQMIHEARKRGEPVQIGAPLPSMLPPSPIYPYKSPSPFEGRFPGRAKRAGDEMDNSQLFTEETVMLRELTSHKTTGLNEALVVEVLDEPGPGGACHNYRIRGMQGPLDHHPIPTIDIRFQNGPLQEVGANGVSNEALLAVVEDRLQGFQSGSCACEENALALAAVQEAMKWLKKRTQDRIARGVEGTSQQ